MSRLVYAERFNRAFGSSSAPSNGREKSVSIWNHDRVITVPRYSTKGNCRAPGGISPI